MSGLHWGRGSSFARLRVAPPTSSGPSSCRWSRAQGLAPGRRRPFPLASVGKGRWRGQDRTLASSLGVEGPRGLCEGNGQGAGAWDAPQEGSFSLPKGRKDFVG